MYHIYFSVDSLRRKLACTVFFLLFALIVVRFLATRFHINIF